MKRSLDVIAVATLFVTLCGCKREHPQAWIKPNRVVVVAADARKSLLIASSSSVLSKYGPLAGVLSELLPIDLKELTIEPASIDWTKERCVWTFDTTVDQVTMKGYTLVIRAVPREGAGLRFWFFDKTKLLKIERIEFD